MFLDTASHFSRVWNSTNTYNINYLPAALLQKTYTDVCCNNFCPTRSNNTVNRGINILNDFSIYQVAFSSWVINKDANLRIKQTTRYIKYPRLHFVIKLYMFRTSPVPIIRSYLLYTRQLVRFMQIMWPLSSRVRLERSSNLMMGTEVARNM
jgi:hypothetical protein